MQMHGQCQSIGGNILINPTTLPFVITYCLYNFELGVNMLRKYILDLPKTM